MKNYLDFEKEIKALEQEVDGLKSPFGSEGITEVDTYKIKNTQHEINQKVYNAAHGITVKWWRRREVNPRPLVRHYWLYMLRVRLLI